MKKIYKNCSEAIADIHDGAVVMVGAFATRGAPENLILALRDKGVKDLTLICNDCSGGWKYPLDADILVENDQVKKVITSFANFGSPKKISNVEKRMLEGKLELEMVPQGTLAERVRAGGAGIGAFYAPASVGTFLAKNKEVRKFEGREMVLEYPIKADFALIKSHKADKYGNLVYRGSAQNFNPLMAAAAKVTIVETENLLDVGELEPDEIKTPCIYVNRIVHVPEGK